MKSSDVLKELALTLEQRKGADPDSSYVAGLLAAGTDAILKKVGEESTEFILAAKGDDNGRRVVSHAGIIESERAWPG